MRPAAVRSVLVSLLVAACSSEGTEPLEVTIPTLPDGTDMLELRDSRPGTQWAYRLRIRSHAKRTVNLQARFEEPAPEGVRLRLARGDRIMRASTTAADLILVVPRKPVAFEGTVVLFADELPGWSKRYRFAGNVVEKALDGPYLHWRPPGILLENLRPGQPREFFFTLSNRGSEEISIRDWEVSDPAHVELANVSGGEIIVPGAELQVNGVVTPPRRATPFRERIRVWSNAINTPRGLDLQISGEVTPDYEPRPPSLQRRTDYPTRQATYRLRIHAREGGDPFFVESVRGHEAFFELASKGTDEPASEQEVQFRLRKDAPTDVASTVSFLVRLRLAPVGAEVEWPVELLLLPPIHPQPHKLLFGKLDWGAPARREVELIAVDNRRFEIVRAKSERGYFIVQHRNAAGLRPVVSVNVSRGLPRGQYEDTIVIELDDPEVPAIHVPVSARIE